MSGETRSTLRFGDRAAAYAAFRPEYPEEAIDEIFVGLGDPNALVVADVGAGTGISARSIADRGARTIAIEPNEKMRERAEAHANVEWRDGSGEHTGLDDASVDVVTAAQAFHWFANDAAMAEFRRIARRRAVWLQYDRDARAPFSRSYGDVVRAHSVDDTEALRMQGIGVFAQFPNARVSRTAFTSVQRLDLDGVMGRAASSSYLPQSGTEAAELRRDLRAIFLAHAESGFVNLALVTFVLRADW